MKFRRRSGNDNNMALLDALACGLGAVLLILILVKFKAFTADPTEEKNKLEAELAASADAISQLQKSIDEVNEKIGLISATQQDTQDAEANTQNRQDKLLQDISTEIAVVADLENQLAAVAKIPTPSDTISLPGKGNQNFITGMKVEGKQIGILIDKSASMMGENLIQVLSNLALNEADRVNTIKWRRTLRTAQWLIARVPDTSRLSVVAFSEQGMRMGQRDINSPLVGDSMRAIVRDLRQVVPDGGTNLQAGIAKLFEVNSRVTDVYLVTDGLPTLGEGLSAGCKGFFTKNKSISAKCRQQLLVETAKRFPKGVSLNVILLPIDGDPFASYMYWDWAKATRGTFLSPAPEWP